MTMQNYAGIGRDELIRLKVNPSLNKFPHEDYIKGKHGNNLPEIPHWYYYTPKITFKKGSSEEAISFGGEDNGGTYIVSSSVLIRGNVRRRMTTRRETTLGKD